MQSRDRVQALEQQAAQLEQQCTAAVQQVNSMQQLHREEVRTYLLFHEAAQSQLVSVGLQFAMSVSRACNAYSVVGMSTMTQCEAIACELHSLIDHGVSHNMLTSCMPVIPDASS